ncbi:MAG: exodeoxyribonuclease VII small subunit [Lachnospiraceae bacterium]|nr:exodeoxyribonuclease VII small subunit [Lachnospiraceae bacterium]
MAEKKQNNTPDAEGFKPEDQTLEELLAGLDELIGKMESEESLEEMFRMYQTGIAMSAACDSKISKIEKEVEIIRNRRYADE